MKTAPNILWAISRRPRGAWFASPGDILAHTAPIEGHRRDSSEAEQLIRKQRRSSWGAVRIFAELPLTRRRFDAKCAPPCRDNLDVLDRPETDRALDSPRLST